MYKIYYVLLSLFLICYQTPYTIQQHVSIHKSHGMAKSKISVLIKLHSKYNAVLILRYKLHDKLDVKQISFLQRNNQIHFIQSQSTQFSTFHEIYIEQIEQTVSSVAQCHNKIVMFECNLYFLLSNIVIHTWKHSTQKYIKS